MLPHIFDDVPERTRGKIVGLYAILVSANIAVWLWALVAFQGNAFLLGTALLAYSFGLRHAFDADHIAAIDNITRKLMQEGRRPLAVGFFFSLGHATIVVSSTSATFLKFARFQVCKYWVGPSISSFSKIENVECTASFLSLLARSVSSIHCSNRSAHSLFESCSESLASSLSLSLKKRCSIGGTPAPIASSSLA
jgi:high-affinity nickel-transport protein